MANLVSVDVAAEALGIGRQFLYRAVASRGAPHYRAGRALRFDVEELREWMRKEATARVTDAHRSFSSQT